MSLLKKISMSFAALAVTASAAFAGEGHISKYDDLAWQTVAPGAEAVILWGSEEKGDAVWAFRMQPGVSFPMHMHTNDYYGLAIQGNWVHIDKDGHEATTAQASFAFVKGGEKHADRCEGPEVCITLVDLDGKRDLLFPE